jgi:hypothetical protein
MLKIYALKDSPQGLMKTATDWMKTAAEQPMTIMLFLK